MISVQDILNELQRIAPFEYQESYDNSGLIVGNPSQEVTGVLVALDCVEAVVEEAIAQKANVIVTHHPIIFSGLKRLTGANYVERTVLRAIENKIALIAIHTNLDNDFYGVNHVIASKLGLQHQEILAPKSATLFKIGVYVPETQAEIVRSAMTAAGAGAIGEYSDCSFTITGEGRFKPSHFAKPHIGTANNLEIVPEVRIEVTVPTHALGAVKSAMYQAHPYEEVAFDVLPLANHHDRIGSGMIGELAEPMDAMEFLKLVKVTFNAGVVRFTEPTKKQVQRIAVCGGSGSFLLPAAKKCGADVFITSDFKYHEFFDAEKRLIIADIGHFESEQYTSEWIVSILMKKFTTFAVRLTSVNTNPINYL
jgi:dinuclear metal center YbgI/SA1388 family protein